MWQVTAPVAPLAEFSDEEAAFLVRPARLPASAAPGAHAPLQRRARAMLREPGPSNTMAAPRDFAAQPFAS